MTRALNKYILLLAGSFALLAGACKKNDDGYAHNPSAPITINSIAPQTGAIGTDILITGTNFSSDTSKIKVSINGVRLRIVGARENQILAFIPEKTGTGPVTVDIDGTNVASADKFTYQFTYAVSTLAGSGNADYADGKGAAASFRFDGVRAQMCIDANDNLYVPDGGNQRIRKVTPDGTVTTIAGSGERGFADGAAATAKFNNPCGTMLDANGNLYVAERNGNRIRKIAPDGTVSTHASGPNDPGTKELTSVAINKTTGAVYWSDFYGDGIYTLKNGTVTKVINYSLPCTIVMDAEGNIYSTHYDNQTVRKWTYNAANATFDNGRDIAGKDRSGGWTDAVGTQALFDRPWGVTLDSENNLYVVGEGGDKKSNCIRKIAAGNANVTTLAGVDVSGFAEGVGNAARFNRPTGVVVGKDGTIYVLDMDNQRIRKITPQ